MTHPKIDFDKILNTLDDNGIPVYSPNEIRCAMRQAAIEAIRLAAPLFAEELGKENYIIAQNIIADAVESVTKQITGE